MYGEGELKTVSESWLKPLDLSTTDDPNISSAMGDDEHFCKLILYKEIQDSRVRIWDVGILVPNVLFLLYMLARFNRARLKLRATSSPIYLAFYGLVVCNIVISVIRCIVSMSVNAAGPVGGTVDKVMWVTVRFFLLATEMSVVIFSLAFGNLDSQSSIRRVLVATAFIALVFTISQGTLEFVLPDDTFHIPSRDFYVFGHGGMTFWLYSSLVFTLIYMFIFILPRTSLRDRLIVPNKKSFYVYVGALATLNLVQSIGAGLLNYTQNPAGLCVVDLTAAVYLTLFTPLVYGAFLWEVFGVSQPTIQFSYKAQVDDAMDEDTVSLPHQQSFSSLRTDSDYIYQVHNPYMHMPLYESLLTEPPSTSKQKSSLYSRKDEKTASTSRSSSLLSLYGASPDAKALLVLRRNTLMSTPDLGKLAMSESENYVDAQKSTPELTLNRRGWSSETSSPSNNPSGPANSGNITHNLVAAPSTASNFKYRPPENDSNANLFSEPGKMILTSAIVNYAIRESFDQSVARIAGRLEVDQGAAGPSSWSVMPPPPPPPALQSSLENMLNSDSRDTVSERHFQNAIELSATKSADSVDSSLDASNVETRIGSSSFSHENPRLARDPASTAEAKQSSGLSDYLQSLKSPKYQSPLKKAESESGGGDP